MVTSWSCRGATKSPLCFDMHLDALLSTPMILDSASSLIVRKHALGATTFPASVDGIAIAGMRVSTFRNWKILPLDLPPFFLLYLEGVLGVAGRFCNAHAMNLSCERDRILSTLARAVSINVSLCDVLCSLVYMLVMRAIYVRAKGPKPVDSDNVIKINTFAK